MTDQHEFHGALVNPSYQGNAWWIFFAVFSVGSLAAMIVSVRRELKAGKTVQWETIVLVILVPLLFIGASVWRLLTHDR